MHLTKHFATKSDCYKAGRTIKVQGLMLHSTGANNPKLSRYVGPDDGILGRNPNNNDWNRPGINKMVHAFIGITKNGDVRTYQTLPWDRRAWHAGGKANDTHIGVEICEDGLNDRTYFDKVYKEAVELFAHLCKTYGLTEKHIIDHREGHARGIASNHGDVLHWFKKHSKSMDTFRADVKRELDRMNQPPVGQPLTTQAERIARAKKLVKNAVKNGTFTSDHPNLDQYSEGRLFEYIMIYAERLEGKL